MKEIRRTLSGIVDTVLKSLPAPLRIRARYFKSHHHLPNLASPKAFSEKITATKVSDTDLSPFVDKVLVKGFVASVTGEGIVIPTLFNGPDLPDADERHWPIPYVVKANNGSGGNYFVRSKEEEVGLDAAVGRFMKYDFSTASDEVFYRRIKPQVLIEPYISTDDTLPLDYKFFVFGGVVHMIQVDTDREHAHKRVFFDKDWNRLDLRFGYPIDRRDIARPAHFDDMIAIAEKIGRHFGFVRVDLYNIDGQIWFGELTFTPESGLMRFDPASKDAELGRLWPWPDTRRADTIRAVQTAS